MKKLFTTLTIVLLGLSTAYAQDLATVTETYNNGATALSEGNKDAALAAFKEALDGAVALGAEGEEIANNCKNYLPEIQFSIAKELVNNQEYDKAIAELKKTVEMANEFGKEETSFMAEDLIPQVLMQKANSLLNLKDFAAAAKTYKSILEINPNNGVAALRLGAALNSIGDTDGAVEAFKIAMANGQEDQAQKQISNIFLRAAASSLKAKNYAAAVEDALKVNEFGENAQAYQIAAQASQMQKKNADAISYFEKYLELAPNAKNATQIAFTLGALYQQAGNKVKAIEFYQQAVTDPKFGAEALKQINALK
jgi:tetratricopeptide (TPR) repeat protein